MKSIKIGCKMIGDAEPCFIIAEIGINHNGDVEIAKKLIDAAKSAGCDAVKFQKRNPDVCVPESQKNTPKETPWGIMTYYEYKQEIEFSVEEYRQINSYCQEAEMMWFVSCWDEDSVDTMESFDLPCYKIASASITEFALLQKLKETEKRVMLSTGMSTMKEIREAVSYFPKRDLLLAHCNSTYPCPVDELNLRLIPKLREEFGCITGYSGHEVGLSPTWAAVVMGAAFVERHITLDRAMWGSDHAASVEPQGFQRLVQNIRDLEAAMGDGIKRVYEGEMKARERLRRLE